MRWHMLLGISEYVEEGGGVYQAQRACSSGAVHPLEYTK